MSLGCATIAAVNTASPSDIRGLVDRLHASRAMAALALTGGGAGAITALLRRHGGSRTVLEAAIPYAPAALDQYLGRPVSGAVSGETARDLAAAAYARALRQRPDSSIPVVGLGATAALATDRPRRGARRLHVATVDGARVASAALELGHPDRSREEDEAIAERLILTRLADAIDIETGLALGLGADDRLEVTERLRRYPIEVVADGEQPWIVARPDGTYRPGGPVPAAVVSGSFDPAHQGHRALIAAARRRVTGFVAYEVSVTNVDKPPLAPATVARRVEQFAGEAGVLITRAPTFVEKARLFPRSLFAIGADTAPRVTAPEYYGGGDAMRAALAELRRLGNRFLVAARHDGSRFVRLDDLAIPDAFRDLFEAIPPDELRVDVASTDLRARGRSAP